MNYLLTAIAALALFGMFAGSAEPVAAILRGSAFEPVLKSLHSGNSILFNLSVSYLGSYFFWLLVVAYPEFRRRKLLRNNLARQYQYFKEAVVQILLWSSVGTHDSSLPKELCDHIRFRAFFDEDGKKNWYAALNGLQERPDYLKDLLFEMELLASEVTYVLNNVPVHDEKVYRSLKLLNENIHRLKNSTVYSYDPVKYVGDFLWGILARWSFFDGQRQDDFVEQTIANV